MASKKRSIAVLVYATALFQVLGYSLKALSENTALAHFLVLYAQLPTASIHLVDQIYVGCLVFSLLWTFFNWSPWPFWIMGSLFFGESLFRSLTGGDAAADVALFADAVRYLWLFVMGYALRLERTLDIEASLPSVRLYLRFALALSFATHGLEAIFQLPGLFDFMVFAVHEFLPFPYSHVFARNALIIIGLVELVLAFLLILKPSRAVLLSLSIWAFVGAYAFAIINPSPYQGWFDAFLMAANYFLPILILSIQGQRTLSPRRVYMRMLKGMRAQRQMLRNQTRHLVRRS